MNAKLFVIEVIANQCWCWSIWCISYTFSCFTSFNML